jgi:hypothetical protein
MSRLYLPCKGSRRLCGLQAHGKAAVAAGIPPQEIRDAAGGNLIRKILEALDTVARLSNDAQRAPKTGAEMKSATIEVH